MSAAKIYILRRGKDFSLPAELDWPIASFDPTAPGMNQSFTCVGNPAHADYLYFPHYLTPIVQQKGFYAVRSILENMLPDFAANERRFLFFNYEDISVPFGIESLVFQISLNRHDHDSNAIAYPYPVDDPLLDGNLEFDQIRYQTSFVGFPGSHPVRPRLVDALSSVTDLQLFVKTNPIFHGHFDEAERKRLLESYNSVMRQSLTVLCPRGAAENTVRFFETMAFGRIPVLIADDAVLPGESLINYDDFIIRVPEAQVECFADHIRSWLASRSPDQLRHHCLQARKAWEMWLRTDRLPVLVAYELGRKCKNKAVGGNEMNTPGLHGTNPLEESAVTAGPAQLASRKQQVCSTSDATPIDIILLTYNRLNYFRQTLQALVENTRYPYRLIIVDNNSGTDLRQFLQEYAGLFDHVVLNDENYFTVAFQRGIACAQSDPYIVSDPDILVPAMAGACWLERLITLHTLHPEMGLIALNLDPTNKPAKLPDVYIGEKTVYNADIVLGNVGTIMQSIKRRYFDGRYLTDWETCDQIRANGGKVGFATRIVAWHLGWDEDRDYPDYLLEKYDYFQKKYGAKTYRMYTENEELLSKMGTTSSEEDYYAFSRPDVQRLVNAASKRILDVGCGAGMLGGSLKQERGVEVWGVEYVPEVAKIAAERLDRVISGGIEDALAQLPDGYFDTIICADVLEHLVDPWQVLNDLKIKLAPGGDLVASIPNIRHWSVVSRLLEGRWEYADAGLLDRTHLRFFTRHDCMLMFEKAGYRINHGEATILHGDNGIPEEIVTALGKSGLNVGTLSEESRHYQFLIKASPYAVDVRQIGGVQGHGDQSDLSQSGLATIVILTWNQLEYTKACLASIAANTPEPYELILIDNGSVDGTVAWLREQVSSDSRIRLIENTENRGFAAGCNQGINAARGEYILLLNNDTVVTPSWLAGMKELLNRYPDVGIVGPMTNSASGVQVVTDAGYSSLAELSVWSSVFRENNRWRIIAHRRVVGFCMLFRRELVEKIGMLDESFGPGNYEDDDYCLRAELAGYRNLIAGDVFIHHEGGATFSGNQLDRGSENRKNRVLFTKKWEPAQLEELLLRRWLALNAIEEADQKARSGDLDGAVLLILHKGIKADPASPAPYIALAEILMAGDRYEDALQVVPEMPLATDSLLKSEIEALCHTALGNDELAQQAAIQAQVRPRAHVVLGTLAARRGDVAEAEKQFRRAIDADPSCSGGWLSLGMLQWGQGKQADAWLSVKRSVVVGPLNSQALAIMRDMAQKLGHQADALQAFATSLSLYPDCRHLALNHAGVLAEWGQEPAALDACEAFLVKFGVDDALLRLAIELRGTRGLYDRLAEAGGQSVSLCLIVRDEEASLPRCLASLKPVVHEMIIMDTGSTDRTVDIATAFGAKVYSHVWNGNFSAARNHGIDQAAGGWILIMDADEVISKLDYEQIGLAVAASTGKREALSVLTRNYTDKVQAKGWTANDGVYPDDEAADGWQPSWKVRLFPNQKQIRFRGDVHEMVEASLRGSGYEIRKASFVVHHYGELEADAATAAEKQRRYFESGMKKLEQNPDDLAAMAELAVQAGELGEFEQAIVLWDRVLAKAPDTVEALFNKGYCLMGMKRYAEALAVSRRALELDTTHKEAAFNYGTCELYAGAPERALAVIDPIAAQNPDYPLLQAIMTVLLLAGGEVEQAFVCFQNLKRMNFAIQKYVDERIERLEQVGQGERAKAISEAMARM